MGLNQYFDVRGDARRAFDVTRNGGIAIIPGDLGYAIIGSTKDAMEKIHRTKRRVPEKLHGLTGNRKLQREIHVVSETAERLIEGVTEGFDFPLGVVAPARTDHRLLTQLHPELFAQATRDGTINIVLNGGSFLDELAALCDTYSTPVFGSSANISTLGVKFCVEDIEPEIKAVADLIVDYGLARWAMSGRSSTIIDVRTFDVIRFGVAFENIRDIAMRVCGIKLPPIPRQNAA
jgi:tRNA A37 threonylcarbamoyladenosine synthetase subunit TsaC/SUA5/YrdC